ncbi:MULTISPECIES: hypothetical protein [Gluconobacter]|uniref:hypothetical protein n=1 Tax=Gluconobacter TaxID=441 RepID=UPI000A3B6D4E|nr:MULTISPECIES: hypothetical protein [Gluconobacter]MBS1023734.1 hypothetical protein [Gluconobacter cerinus]MBS1036186.1 hypothetical protein [Gluconobacter cerinus]MBS1044664.1 hypothetical protein [Gluconobacter cerinus]OUJ08714.1 hypothetical protein HK24_09550 [Gluconobacter sp. DsW_058]
MTRSMRSALALAALLTATPALAEPGGCIKYGAAGAVGGHLANHHGVIGAVGGCAAGMYRRHLYRKDLREKAALWDKEHPAAPNTGGWWQSHHDATSVNQKAQWYDAEHPEPGTNAPGPQAPQH